MSEKCKNGQGAKQGRKTKKKEKRPATSPLNESERSSKTSSTGSKGVVTQGETSLPDSGENVSTRNQQITWDNNTYMPNMSYSQQFSGYGFGNQGSPMMHGNYPTQPAPGQSPGLPPQSPIMMNGQPPDWAIGMMNDIKDIKSKVMKIDKIESTVTQIQAKIGDMEINIGNINRRLETVETSCTFISSQHDDQRKEMEKTQSDMKKLKQSCETLEKNAKCLENDKTSLESKLVDLEYRSMRDNLMFYGINEKAGENCEEELKIMLEKTLKFPEAKNLTFDRVHRVGKQQAAKTRPIVAKFHYYKEREIIRSKSFDCKDDMKKENFGIGTQMPKQMRDNRNSLREIMRQESEKGHEVKLIRDKLFVNGRPYTGNTGAAASSR